MSLESYSIQQLQSEIEKRMRVRKNKIFEVDPYHLCREPMVRKTDSEILFEVFSEEKEKEFMPVWRGHVIKRMWIELDVPAEFKHFHVGAIKEGI